MKNKPPVVLCILDGWGIGNSDDFNAIHCAETPNYDFLIDNFPTSKLRADGEYVGLSANQVGNSEVGHMTIGAGRTILMNLPKINQLIERDLLKDNEVVQSFIKSLKKSGGIAHLAGLFSRGGVHAHSDHMIYLANVMADEGLEVNLHLFLDGRDVFPKTALADVKLLNNILKKNVKVVTLIGRFYAMDRDNRWDRIEKAHHLLASGVGEVYDSPQNAILSRYEVGETDEFIKPIVLGNYKGFAKNGDALCFVNYRSDRARELLSSLCDPEFDKFLRPRNFKLISQIGLIEYSRRHSKFMDSVLVQETIKNCLGECLSRAQKTQFRLAETEKYPHVTFFFNSGREIPSEGESRFMVPSPRVDTYDLKPEMSAVEITDKLLDLIHDKKFDFILVNYANPDMVGHTGSLTAATKACEAVDRCLGRLYRHLKSLGGILLLTSDHGNCEEMFDPINNSPHTSHTLNSVPFTVIGLPGLSMVKDGSLSDIAPTVLDVLNIDLPDDMTGRSLLIN